MTRSLLERWCPEPHDSPITAVDYDHASGCRITVDSGGLIAVYMAGSPCPTQLIQHQGPIGRALSLASGGEQFAVGDEQGRVSVYRCADGQAMFVDERPADHSNARATQAVALSPDGRTLASLAADGRIRLVDLTRRERVATYSNFGGDILLWDPSSTRLVAGDRNRQPTLVQVTTRERIGFPLIAGGMSAARFTPDGQRIILLGDNGLTLVDVAEMEIIVAKGADRSSGMLSMVISPDGGHLAVLSARSVHYFQVDTLAHVGKQKHRAARPTGAALWDAQGVAIADEDGRMHRPDEAEPLPNAVCVSGVAPARVVGHEHQLAFWRDSERLRIFTPRVVDASGEPRLLEPGERIVEVAMDAEGRVLAALPEGMGLHVYDIERSHLLFDAGLDTQDAPRIEVAVGVVACLLEPGGMRWFDLRNNRTFELDWARDFALTGGGSWLAVITPRGRIRVLDPTTGEDAITVLPPIGDTPARLLAFMHRRPELLALDEEGILGLYDLTPAARDKAAPEVHRILSFHDAEVDALWGLADGKHAVVRIQEPAGSATVITVDLDTGEVVHELTELLPYVTVDPVSGVLLEPAPGNAVLERATDGRELRVLRALPRGEWVSFEERGILRQSGNAAAWLGSPGPTRRERGRKG